MKCIKKFLMDLWMCLNWWRYLPNIEIEPFMNKQQEIQSKEI